MNIAQEWGNTVKEISEGRRRLGMRRKKDRGGHGGKHCEGVGRLRSGGD